MSIVAVSPDVSVVGVFAGGRGQRMGGCDKARLPAPDSGEPLLERLLRLADEAGLASVVVGGSAPEGRLLVRDDPAGIGPIGGLCGLLAYAGERPAIALACDLPYVTGALLARLVQAPSATAVVAARDPETSKWQPLFARYDAARVLPALRIAITDGVRSFQTFLRALEVSELELNAAEHALLCDWDQPSDVARR